MAPEIDTGQLRSWVLKFQQGDHSAFDELIRHTGRQLEAHARQMLRRYPGVRRWEQTDDVFQSALVRLERALRQVLPTDRRHFFALAARHVRWELRDLRRHYFGPEGLGAHHASWGADSARPPDPADPRADPARAAASCDLLEAVKSLPEDARGVFDLLFYQGLTEAETAEVLGVTMRTVRTRWAKARVLLGAALSDRAE